MGLKGKKDKFNFNGWVQEKTRKNPQENIFVRQTNYRKEENGKSRWDQSSTVVSKSIEITRKENPVVLAAHESEM